MNGERDEYMEMIRVTNDRAGPGTTMGGYRVITHLREFGGLDLLTWMIRVDFLGLGSSYFLYLGTGSGVLYRSLYTRYPPFHLYNGVRSIVYDVV